MCSFLYIFKTFLKKYSCHLQLLHGMCIIVGKKRRVVNQTNQNDMFLQVLELHPEILHQILSTVLNVIMFEDCRNQWSMSRPLLGLILLNEEVCIRKK